MKKIIGGLLIVIGVLSGLYVGGYLMFIKGMIQLVQSITPEVIPNSIAWGAAKIFFAGFVGTIVGYMFGFPGIMLINSD